MPDPAFSPPDGMNVEVLALQPDGSILFGEDLTWAADPIRPAVTRLLPGGEPDVAFQAALEDLPLPDDCPPDAELFGEVCSETFAATALATQTDGRILIGGFRTTTICGPENCRAIDRHFVARLHPDGRYDDTFRIGQVGTLPAAFIRSLIVQPDGRVLVAGYFTAIDGQARPGVARLHPDGSIDASFVPGLPVANETVATTSLALQPDGRILIGRDIIESEQIVRYDIARLNPDGSSDASFNAGAGVNGSVHSIAVQPDGKLIIAGDFTSVGGVDHYRVVRLHPDGSVDVSFNAGTGADAAVYAMATPPDGSLFIGGEFNSFNGLARPGLAKLHAGPRSSVPFATWVARFGLSGPDAAAGADPDRDALPNAAEFIFGGNPAVPSQSERPSAASGDGTLTFRFPRDDRSETPDVTLTVESGANLVSWPTVFTIGPDTDASSPGVIITENGTDPDMITVAIPRGSATRLFARMKVTIIP
jgi:uncharacterized delta-60 repeat protein